MSRSRLDSYADLNYGYPATINTPKEARLCASAAQAVVGSDGLRTGPEIMTMGGEDFSYFLAEKPGCMVFVGSRPPAGELFPHHHPSFDIDEKALLVVGTCTMPHYVPQLDPSALFSTLSTDFLFYE